MKRYLFILTLFVSAISFAAEAPQFCASIPWNANDFGKPSYSLFCGKSGVPVFWDAPGAVLQTHSPYIYNITESNIKARLANKIAELHLHPFENFRLFNAPFKIYSTDPLQNRPKETLVVVTRERINNGFSGKVIGYYHTIYSSHGITSDLEDDLQDSHLKNYLSQDGFTRIVNAKEGFDTIDIYIR